MLFNVCEQLTVTKDQLMMKFLVDDEDALVDTAERAFDVNAPIYVGGVPRGFVSPSETLVSILCCALADKAELELLSCMMYVCCEWLI